MLLVREMEYDPLLILPLLNSILILYAVFVLLSNESLELFFKWSPFTVDTIGILLFILFQPIIIISVCFLMTLNILWNY